MSPLSRIAGHAADDGEWWEFPSDTENEAEKDVESTGELADIAADATQNSVHDRVMSRVFMMC